MRSAIDGGQLQFDPKGNVLTPVEFLTPGGRVLARVDGPHRCEEGVVEIIWDPRKSEWPLRYQGGGAYLGAVRIAKQRIPVDEIPVFPHDKAVKLYLDVM